MKVWYCSDLHLEFQRGNSQNPILPLVDTKNDILILAGDIYTPWSFDGKLAMAMEFFLECSEKFSEVFIVAGNHEHYNGYFLSTTEIMREHFSGLKNFFVMDNTSHFDHQNGIGIFGATFWTDLANGSPIASLDAETMMNDFRLIYFDETNPRRLTTDDIMRENKFSRQMLTKFLSECEQYGLFPIVMSHQAPSMICIPECYRGSALNPAYANTGLDDILYDTSMVWIHGHIHTKMVHNIGGATILCNPRGYIGYEEASNGFSMVNVDIDISEVSDNE